MEYLRLKPLHLQRTYRISEGKLGNGVQRHAPEGWEKGYGFTLHRTLSDAVHETFRLVIDGLMVLNNVCSREGVGHESLVFGVQLPVTDGEEIGGLVLKGAVEVLRLLELGGAAIDGIKRLRIAERDLTWRDTENRS